ncbi:MULTISPECIES: ABC transporter ATP-binding protein [Ramlibacter]|uniref:ATP-binding cassette domain-containing protein n=1 Tax=Ramlibacter pinisoli TaxID=2682844 RepID=A0A6N8ISA1_9BURK|nr:MULTISPECIES: ABC transporter ATP-binding protein [Ramlibacter]MBA2964834.1 ABC transporter ATP-binding protein [Ramlibacter sp. CGMCC 1.13660]MVQ29799.1 ATP-binding cassette domain-containing protein [Ramlibacter pinisoli]
MSDSTEIVLSDVSLRFRLYQEKNVSLKEKFADLLKGRTAGHSKEFWALQQINLRIAHGERVGIVGHNGAGKSTLLKTICRIYEPTNGSLQVCGKVAPLLEIGAGFNPELSGRENIFLNGAILGFRKSELREIEEEVVEFTQLGDFINAPVKYYSTGMYMKLAFAIATSVHPEILILDELFAGGDAEFIDRAQARMAKFVDSSSILVFVSHQESLVRQLCNRVIWLDHGRVVADGPTSDVLHRYLNK